MTPRFPAAATMLAVLALTACTSTAPTGTSAPAEPVQREYRTGSKFPVKDPYPPMTQEERNRQIDEARAAAQSAVGSGAPPRAIGQ